MPGKPRIAILGSRGIPATYGGFETFAEMLSTGLAGMGLDVTVFCTGDGQGTRLSVYNGVRLEYVASPRCGPFTTILFDLLCLWRARRGFDVVYMLGYGASLFCFIPRIGGNRVWINMDGIEWARSKWSLPARLWLKAMESVAMRTCNVVIADADAIADHLRKRHRTVPELHVIPYGAELVRQPPDLMQLVPWQLEPERYYLIVCRLEPENHVLEIIQGYRASTTEIPLVIVGDQRAGTSYVEKLLAVKDDRIRFLGTVFDKEVLRALRYYCTAYFHGHSVGGTNPSLLEALGCGNIVVAHNNVFNREVAGDAGLYFSSEQDIPAIIDAVDAMDGMRRTARSARARKRIQDAYTWDRITKTYADLLLQRQGTAVPIDTYE